MKKEIIWTIKELYEWAVKNNCENYIVYGQDKGAKCNLVANEIDIIDKKREVYIC